MNLVDPMPVHSFTGLRALGLRVDGSPLWPIVGSDGEEGEGEGEGDESDEEDPDEEEEDESDSEDKSGKKKRTGPVSRAEFEAVTNRLSAADKRRAAAEKERDELKKFKDEHERKGNSELQNAQKDLETVTAERDSYRDRFTALARTNAFLTASAQAGITWHDPEDAQAAAGKDLRELEIDEDGRVEGMAQLVKDLAKRKKYLVNTGSKKDEDDEEGGERRTRGASGSGVGSVKGRAKGSKPKGQLTPEELRRRFPALNK